MKRLVGVLAFLGVTATAPAVVGQEIQIRGPLAGAPSCRHCVQYRSLRFSVAPTFGLTLQDEFDRAMFIGAQLNFHINDLIAIGAWGGFAPIHISTGLTSEIQRQLSPASDSAEAADPSLSRSNATPNIPRGERFPQQVGQINWLVSAPQVTLIPLRGKLSLFQNIFVDTDFYLFAGLGIVGLTERKSFTPDVQGVVQNGQPPPTGNDAGVVANQLDRASRTAFTGTFGVGINLYINHFMSLQIEYRAFPMSWNTMGTDESSRAQTCGADGASSCGGFPDYAVRPDLTRNAGGVFRIDDNDSSFHWNQMVNVGLNFFLPPAPQVGE